MRQRVWSVESRIHEVEGRLRDSHSSARNIGDSFQPSGLVARAREGGVAVIDDTDLPLDGAPQVTRITRVMPEVISTKTPPSPNRIAAYGPETIVDASSLSHNRLAESACLERMSGRDGSACYCLTRFRFFEVILIEAFH